MTRMFLHNINKRIKRSKEIRDWKRRGKPVPPPPFVKQIAVEHYAKKFSLDTLVETGTYLGDMVEASKNTFRRIFSIELDTTLYNQARHRFSAFDHIVITQGDSGEVLPHVLAGISDPCLFWLDGHYSAGITARGQLETPVMEELGCILDHPVADHVILIDDARLFVGQHDYPTIEELQKSIFEKRPGWFFEVKDDIIRIHKGDSE